MAAGRRINKGNYDMKRFVMLLRLEIKKYRKGFPGLLLSAAILCLIVFGMALMGQQLISGVGSITQENGQEQKKDSKSFKTKISAAMVIEDESKAMKLAAMMLDKMDSVNTILDIDYVSAKEGKHLLEENKVAVLIRIPENTVKSIMNGENQPIEIEFPENSGYEAAVFKECADAAVQLLASAQAGIYTIYDFYKEYGIYNKKDRTIDRMNEVYIKAALNRENMYEEEEVAVTGELSVAEYYLCAGLVLFVLFFSIMPVRYMRRNNGNLSARLAMAGTGHVRQVLASLAGCLMIYLMLFLIAAAVFLAAGYSDAEWTEEIDPGLFCRLLLSLIPAVLCNSAFALMICRITDTAMAQVMLMFLAAFMQALMTGCFIPEILLPEALRGMSGVLPAHYMMKLTAGVFRDTHIMKNLSGVCVLAGYTVICVLLAAAFEKKRWIPGRRKA